MTNTCPEYQDGMISFDEISLKARAQVELDKVYAELCAFSPATGKYSFDSMKKKSFDPAIYVGTGGNIYVQWRLYELYKALKEPAKMTMHLNLALEALKVNEELWKKKMETEKSISPSFFMGEPGLFTMGVILYKEAGKKGESLEYFDKLKKYIIHCKGPHYEDELLYGNAGYLYCLLKVYSLDHLYYNCSSEIIEVVKLLQTSGQRDSFGLTYTFPRSHGKKYLGAAHGTFGILYLIVKSMEIIEGLKADVALTSVVEKTLKNLMGIQFETGNFPIVMGNHTDKLIHFCHGAPGAIALFAQAYKVFKNEEYLLAALQCGEVTWQRGLLYKGNSLCHGITGNGYLFYQLYELTGDPKWRYSSWAFAEKSWDPEIRATVKAFVDPMRAVIGTPDTPYSLMEGIAGDIVFYADLLHAEDGMKFPGLHI